MDTCELLVPDISLHTASRSTSVEQVSIQAVEEADPAVIAAEVEVETSKEGVSMEQAGLEKETTSQEQEETQMEVDAQPECDPIAVPEQASQELHSSQDISRQPISGEEESRAKKSKSKSKCKPAIFQLCRRFNHTFFRPLEPASSINPCS